MTPGFDRTKPAPHTSITLYEPPYPAIPRDDAPSRVGVLDVREFRDVGDFAQPPMKYFLYCRKSTEDEGRQILSIESQEREAAQKFAHDPAVSEIIVITESRSAKAPGRPVFDDMMRRIERGEASGIIAWAPDRLARNSIDGGRIIYDLDHGALADLKFATYTFENNAQGKFMLQVMFGYSKYYSDALSENVKRGNRAKLARGWRPSKPPFGYQTDPLTKTTIPHPEHFPLVRRMFDLAITGVAPREIARRAKDEWGLRTVKRKKRGGKPLTLSAIYKLLGNPFYAGVILWDGQVYAGKQEPAVSMRGFEAVQARFGRQEKPRPKKYAFPFTGMIRCGSCDYMITAEQKRKPSGRVYTYYHCTKRGLGPKCREAPISAPVLIQEFERFLASIIIHPELHRWTLRALETAHQDTTALASTRIASLTKTAQDVQAQLKELMRLRLRSMIDDETYDEEQRRLEMERIGLNQELSKGGDDNRLELASTAISLSKYALEWFRSGSDDLKRTIVEIVGQNSVLSGKKLNVQAAKPFMLHPFLRDFLLMCTTGEDNRNLGAQTQAPLASGLYTADTPCPDGLRPLVDRYLEQVLSGLDDEEDLRDRLQKVRERFPHLFEEGVSGPAGTAQAVALRAPRRRPARGFRQRPFPRPV